VVDVKTTAVRTWVATMVAEELGVANPCDGVQLPKRKHADRGYLTHTQVAALAAAVEYRPEVVRFLAYTGLRWGEMSALRVGDFDMLRRRVNVSRSVTEFNGLAWSTPKSWERRSVPFPAALTAELAALMVGKGRDDLVFASQRGDVLRASNYRKRFFTAAVEKCQATDKTFPTITPHDLRHTAASLAVSAGANVKAVQRMLGHAKASMTLDVYADLFDDDLDGIAVRLDAAIKSAADSLRTKSMQ
jgi:integrase